MLDTLPPSHHLRLLHAPNRGCVGYMESVRHLGSEYKSFMKSSVLATKCLHPVLDSGSSEANGLAITDEGLCLTGARGWSTFVSSKYKDVRGLYNDVVASPSSVRLEITAHLREPPDLFYRPWRDLQVEKTYSACGGSWL